MSLFFFIFFTKSQSKHTSPLHLNFLCLINLVSFPQQEHNLKHLIILVGHSQEESERKP
ncbi:hypothetical protein LINGRAHAP2_LOCUS30830 [Linum grandiflorum]